MLMQRSYQFTRAYIDVHEAEEDLLQVFSVTRLPAYALCSATEILAQDQAATPEAVQITIGTLCLPVLMMNEDF